MCSSDLKVRDQRVHLPVHHHLHARVVVGRGDELRLRRLLPHELGAGGARERRVASLRVVEAGAAFDLRQAGYHALEHLRLERGFREFGLDLTPDDTLYEAGLDFAVRLDKPADFIGRTALEAQHGKTLSKRLVLFKLEDPEPLLYKDELIRLDGRIVGHLGSGAYGYTLGA